MQSPKRPVSELLVQTTDLGPGASAEDALCALRARGKNAASPVAPFHDLDATDFDRYVEKTTRSTAANRPKWRVGQVDCFLWVLGALRAAGALVSAAEVYRYALAPLRAKRRDRAGARSEGAA